MALELSFFSFVKNIFGLLHLQPENFVVIAQGLPPNRFSLSLFLKKEW